MTPEERATITERKHADEGFGGRTKVIKIVIDDEGEKALSPEVEELLRRRAAEVGFSTLDWIVHLLELHAEQDEEDEPEDEE
jgi:hypothetical protein